MIPLVWGLSNLRSCETTFFFLSWDVVPCSLLEIYRSCLRGVLSAVEPRAGKRAVFGV